MSDKQTAKLNELLKKHNLTLKQITEKYSIPYNTMRQWLNGKRKMPIYLLKLIEKDLDRG